MIKTFDVSAKTLLKIAIFVLIFYFLYQIKEILLWILYAFALSVLFEKPIEFLSQKKIPRSLATLFVYLFIFSLFAFLIYFSLKPLFFEIQNFIYFLPQYFEKISPTLKIFGIISVETLEELTKGFQNWVQKISTNIVSLISGLFGGFFAAFSIISMAFFLSLEKEGMEKLISKISGSKEEFFLKIWIEAKEKISSWFGVKLLGCCFVGIVTFICLIALKVNYPFSLSVLAGILNFIPILGPIISAILIFIVASLDSIFKGFFALGLFSLLQTIEGNLIGPIFGEKFVGFPPFLILISLLIGGKLLGIGGAILAVPLTGIFFKILQEIFKE